MNLKNVVLCLLCLNYFDFLLSISLLLSLISYCPKVQKQMKYYFVLGIGMHVEIRDPDDKIILSKVYSTEGKWTFTSRYSS